MTLAIVLQFVVVLAAIWMGARYSGVGLGLWGAVGLLVLVVAFGVDPTSPPIDVMLIILAVIMAASVMDAAGRSSRRLRPGALRSSRARATSSIRCCR
jgi:anaerobic C4-dicarboxylate transporter